MWQAFQSVLRKWHKLMTGCCFSCWQMMFTGLQRSEGWQWRFIVCVWRSGWIRHPDHYFDQTKARLQSLTGFLPFLVTNTAKLLSLSQSTMSGEEIYLFIFLLHLHYFQPFVPLAASSKLCSILAKSFFLDMVSSQRLSSLSLFLFSVSLKTWIPLFLFTLTLMMQGQKWQSIKLFLIILKCLLMNMGSWILKACMSSDVKFVLQKPPNIFEILAEGSSFQCIYALKVQNRVMASRFSRFYHFCFSLSDLWLQFK